MREKVTRSALISALLFCSGCTAKSSEIPAIPTYPAEVDYLHPELKGSEASLTFVKDSDLKYPFYAGVAWVVEPTGNEDPVTYDQENLTPEEKEVRRQIDQLSNLDISPFLIRLTRIEAMNKDGLLQKETLIFERPADLMKSNGKGNYGATGQRGPAIQGKRPGLILHATSHERFLIRIPPQPKGLYRLTVKTMSDMPFFKDKHIIFTASSTGEY